MGNAGAALAALERLTDLVRQDDPALAKLEFAAESAFQTRTVSQPALAADVAACLARDFRARAPEDFPALYCACGKARVGSTALTNLFGLAGMPSYYQPVKAIQRRLVMGESPSAWSPPVARQHAHIFSKETIGPYTLAECVYNPLQLLVEAGYPTGKLHLILLEREPMSALASWLDKWSLRVEPHRLTAHYVIAALNVPRIEDYARRHGIPVTHYVYEASREPVQAARALFRRLGLAERFAEDAVVDWKEKGELASGKSEIIFPIEPAIYEVPGLHGADTAYRYRDRRSAQVTDQQRRIVSESGVEAVYRAAVRAAIRDLDFDDATAARLFGSDVLEQALPPTSMAAG